MFRILTGNGPTIGRCRPICFALRIYLTDFYLAYKSNFHRFLSAFSQPKTQLYIYKFVTCGHVKSNELSVVTNYGADVFFP